MEFQAQSIESNKGLLSPTLNWLRGTQPTPESQQIQESRKGIPETANKR